jgi:NitT/TauT family transport system permease protein
MRLKKWLKWLNWQLLLIPLPSILLYRWWLTTAESEKYPAFMLPHPDTVRERFMKMWDDGSLERHVKVTMKEALWGLFIASLVAIILGYLLARIRWLSYLTMPYLIFTQAIPIIAVAPLIIIWAGPEIKSKIVIAALITWFPIMVSTMVGIRNVSPNLRELMRANVANPWQIFWNLEVPSALPEILGGIKVGVTLSIIGAAVGEFVSSREGLGYLVFFGKSISRTDIVIVAIFSLTLMSLSLFGIVAAVEQVLLRWKYAGSS